MENMVVSAVWLSREGERFVPMMRVHEGFCKADRNCACRWEDISCLHLSSGDRIIARARARGLAKRIGVPYLGSNKKGRK